MCWIPLSLIITIQEYPFLFLFKERTSPRIVMLLVHYLRVNVSQLHEV